MPGEERMRVAMGAGRKGTLASNRVDGERSILE
jgi:hypothetical protein